MGRICNLWASSCFGQKRTWLERPLLAQSGRSQNGMRTQPSDRKIEALRSQTRSRSNYCRNGLTGALKCNQWNGILIAKLIMPGFVPGIHGFGFTKLKNVDGREEARP